MLDHRQTSFFLSIMETEKEVAQVREVSMVKPNYMLMSLQRILVLTVILAGVLVVVHYTPMPGNKLLFVIPMLNNRFKLIPDEP